MKIDTSVMKGIIVPILTPIDKDELIDEAVLRRMVDHVIQGGVHGILAFGSNGEFYCVEEDEAQRGLRIILDQAAGRVPVYCSVGAISTKKCIRMAKMAAAAGAAGVSVLQPMFVKPTEEELYRHFRSIAEAIPETPVLLYNNPARTGYGITPKLALRLAADVENIVGAKDSSGDMTVTCEYIRLTRGMDFKVFGGKDTLIYSAIAAGAAGCVATTANMFPQLVCSIYNLYAAGDIQGSLDAQYRLTPVRLTMDMATFPVGTKDLANLMGLEVGSPYLPTQDSPESLKEVMRQAMKGSGLL